MGSALSRFIGILVRPGNTMREIDADPQVNEARLAIILYVITNVAVNFVSGGTFPITGFLDWMIALISGTILCLVLAFGLHFSAKLFGGTGKLYPNMYVAVGYSFFIMAIGNVLSIFITALGLDNYDSMSALILIISILLMLVLLAILVIWLAYLWFLSLRNIEKLKTLSAVAVTAIGIVIFMILQIALAVVLSFI